MSIASNIKVHRKKNKLSQSELADMLGLTRQQIANYESGGGTIPLTSVIKMSEIFNISIDELVKGDASKVYDEMNEPLTIYTKISNGDEIEKVKQELQRLKYRVEDYERVFRLMGISKDIATKI